MNRDFLRYDGLIISIAKKYNCIKTKIDVEDVLQEGRIKVWKTLINFQNRCNKNKRDSNPATEFVFVRNQLDWFFYRFKNKIKSGNDILMKESIPYPPLNGREENIPNQKRIMVDSIDDFSQKIKNAIHSDQILLKRWHKFMNSFNNKKDCDINGILSVLKSSNVSVKKYKKSFLKRLFKKIDCPTLDISAIL